MRLYLAVCALVAVAALVAAASPGGLVYDAIPSGGVDGSAISPASVTASGTVQAEQLTSTDDATIYDALTLGTTALDGGAITIIKGAQVGDPQASLSLGSNQRGDFSVAATGDIFVDPAGGDVWVAGNLGLAGDLINADDLYSDAVATDSAPEPTVLSPQAVYPVVGAANTTGAALVLGPTPGGRTLTGVTKAGAGGKTITAQAYADGVALAACIKTEGTGAGGTFECDGAASDEECVDNLYAVYVASPCPGVVVSHVPGTEALAWFITPGVTDYLTITLSDAINYTLVNGTDGAVLVNHDGSAAVPSLSWVGDTNTGFYRKGADDIGVTLGGSNKVSFASTVTTYYQNLETTGNMTVYNSAYYKFGTDRESLGSPADKQFRVTGSGGSTYGSVTIDHVGLSKGEAITFGTPSTASQTVTFAANPGNASKTTSGLIPDGAFLLAVTTRTVTASTNCTTCDIGDGSDVDMFGAAIECDVNDTLTTNANATAAWTNPQLAATEVTVTANGGNCYGGTIRITATYITATAPALD
jgi:hypothetical protein